MGEVLSQSEIDNLLAAFSTGELDVEQMQEKDEKHVKDYDFKRPAKFSKEHLRTLEIIYEHYGRLVSTNLPVYLRKNVQIGVASSETVTFSEFTNALSTPSILGIVSFAPLAGNIIIELSTNIGFAMIDRMLGGFGEPLDKARDFSEIERSIIEKMMVICMQLMREPWRNVVDINPMMERIETNPQFAQIISPSDMIAIVTLNIKIGEVDGLMNICLPYLTVEDVIDKLNTKYWYANMQQYDEVSYADVIEVMIRKAQIPIRAVLGQTTLSVSDFSTLQVGDIIRLDRNVEEDFDVYVGNIKKFSALPGTSGDNYAVRITEVIREEQ